MWSYRIHCIWEHLKTLNVPFASSKTRSTSFNPIHCDGIFSVKNSRCTYLRGKFSCMKIFICQDTVQKHFQIPRWDGYKNEVMKNWEQTHTRTRPKVAFCILKNIAYNELLTITALAITATVQKRWLGLMRSSAKNFWLLGH